MTLQREAPALVLASGSATRAALLRGAGLRFEVVAAEIDEAVVRGAARARGEDASAAARMLAAAKATTVSRARQRAMVIGADQILECEGTWFEKPAGREEAAAQLRALGGRTHRLVSGVACAVGGEVCWSDQSEARLRFRAFSEQALQGVLAADAASIGGSVGGYRLEGPGVLLCEAIEGDHFTILGLPLLPLFAFLREAGVLVG